MMPNSKYIMEGWTTDGKGHTLHHAINKETREKCIVWTFSKSEFCPDSSNQDFKTIFDPLLTLRCPYISDFRDYFEDNQNIYLVVAKDGGETLKDVMEQIRNRKLEPSFAVRVGLCRQLIYAISCLHLNEVVHGNISAAGVIVLPNEKIKITDFALKRFIKRGLCGGTHSENESALLERPPSNRIFKSEVDSEGKASDIFDLGILCSELLSLTSQEELESYAPATLEQNKLKLEIIIGSMLDANQATRATAAGLQQAFERHIDIDSYKVDDYPQQPAGFKVAGVGSW